MGLERKRVFFTGLNSFTAYHFCLKYWMDMDIGGVVRPGPIPFSEKMCRQIFKLSLGEEQGWQEALEDFKPDIIVNTVAIGNVDYCETHTEEAQNVNVSFPLSIASIIGRLNTNIKLLHLSSNAVYDGDNPPYSEISPMHPVNTYGRLKKEADEKLAERDIDLLIMRPITMFGDIAAKQRPNPYTFIRDRLMQGNEMKLVDDIFANMLFIDDFVGVLKAAIDRGVSGVYNIAGRESISRFEFGRIIAECMGVDSDQVQPSSSAEFRSLAPRPKDTTFDIKAARKDLDYNPTPIAEAIKLILERDRL